MSAVTLGHLRRTLLAAANKQSVAAATTVLTKAAPSHASSTGGIHSRHLSGGKKKGGGATPDPSLNGSYKARKDAAKQKRCEAWEHKLQRLENLKTRRDRSERGVKGKEFRSWWNPEMIYHNKIQRQARQEGKTWRIRVAAMVERLPVVVADLEPWETDYQDLNAYLGSFGKEFPPETGFMPPPSPSDHEVLTMEEMIAMLPFTPAPRETEADETGDVKTQDRRLKTRVYLAIQTDKEGNMSGPRWSLPSAIANEDETLLSTAQRAVSESVGTDLELWCPSNCPMAVNIRPYGKNLPEEIRENYFGEKIYYYRVQVDDGDVDEDALSVDDYAWLTREEIVKRVEEERGKHQAKFFHHML